MRDYSTPMEDKQTASIAIQAYILTSEIASQTDLPRRGSLRDLLINQFAKRSMCNSVAERTKILDQNAKFRQKSTLNFERFSTF